MVFTNFRWALISKYDHKIRFEVTRNRLVLFGSYLHDGQVLAYGISTPVDFDIELF